MQEDSDNLEVRRKIIELANMMQYDDDIEESQVKTNYDKTSQPSQSKQDKVAEVVPNNVQQEESDDEIFDDVQMLIERQNNV